MSVQSTSSDDYELIRQIGVGSFATVYLARHKHHHDSVAIKIIDMSKTQMSLADLSEETTILRTISHENVIKLISAFCHNDTLWMVMPYMEHSLKNIIRHNKLGIKNEAFLATVLYEVLKGLQYLHKNSIIHRDLKSSNILISNKGEVKLCDFGVAGKLIENGVRSTRNTFTGTVAFMAPEIMEQTEYDCKVDMWSFGILALELAYGHAPYEEFTPFKIVLKTLEEEPPSCEIYHDNTYKFHKSFSAMVSKCLKKKPADRTTATKLLDHKFFKFKKDATVIIEHLNPAK